jgi:hypothetical protein
MSARIKPSLEAQRLAAAASDVSLALPAESVVAGEVAPEMQILVKTDNGLEMKCFQYCRP